MEWGILIIILILLFLSYVIVQETRAQMHWRGLVQQGDVDAIRQLIEAEIEQWHTERVPKNVPALLWHGIQTVALTDVSAKGARLNCSAEGEYALVAGKRIETSSALTEAMKITMKLTEMVFYDIPNLKLAHAQIDVYTSFRDASGHAEPRCILSTRIQRRDFEHLDWDGTAPTEFVGLAAGHFSANGSGTIQPVEPLPWLESATRRA